MINVGFVALDEQYAKRLDEIKETITNSEELAAYLDTEEHDEYEALRNAHEPSIHELYLEVANANSPQLISLEKALLVDDLEGLYLGKALNHAALRGSYNEEFKYNIPQEHLKDIILFIANSVNFESLVKTCKQGLQLALAISSDVWVTNILKEINNKKVIEQIALLKPYKREFFKQRRSLLVSLKRQFKSVPFHSFGTPKDLVSLRRYINDIIYALTTRGEEGQSNDFFAESLTDILSNKDFTASHSYMKLLVVSAFTVGFSEKQSKEIMLNISKVLEDETALGELYVELGAIFSNKKLTSAESVSKATSLIGLLDNEYATIITNVDNLSKAGVTDEDTQAVYVAKTKEFPELSTQADLLRDAAAAIFKREAIVLPKGDQKAFIELFRGVEPLITGFDNEGFSKSVKETSLNQIKDLIRLLTNRRSAEYQEVKGFMATTLKGHGFVTDKSIKELIKKKKEVA